MFVSIRKKNKWLIPSAGQLNYQTAIFPTAYTDIVVKLTIRLSLAIDSILLESNQFQQLLYFSLHSFLSAKVPFTNGLLVICQGVHPQNRVRVNRMWS